MTASSAESFARTGHPADLVVDDGAGFSRYPASLVLEALETLTWDEFTTVTVLDPLSTDPVLCVERDERVARVEMSAFLGELRRSRVPSTVGAVAKTLRRWVDTRAVSDREATAAGLRVLAWADGTRSSLAWDVAVPRNAGWRLWRPGPLTSATVVARVRGAAHVAALQQAAEVDATRDGFTLVWRHRSERRLSSVVVLQPDRVRADADKAGMPEPLTLVLAPGYPVVGASEAAVRRLVEESTGDHVVLPERQLAGLGWK